MTESGSPNRFLLKALRKTIWVALPPYSRYISRTTLCNLKNFLMKKNMAASNRTYSMRCPRRTRGTARGTRPCLNRWELTVAGVYKPAEKADRHDMRKVISEEPQWGGFAAVD